MMNTLFRRTSGILRSGESGMNMCRCSFSASSISYQQGTTKKQEEHPPNSSINPGYINNRNPRNLEKLRIAEKEEGWDLDKVGRSFWNKLALEITGKHISAKVVHVYGQTPVSASTNEWCIKKFLYSTKDAPAAKAIGEVLAHRCLQAGITEVACFFSEEDRLKDKVAIFLKALEDGGVSLEESSQIQIPFALNHPTLPEKSWEVHEHDIEDKLEEAAKILPIVEKIKSKGKSKS